MNVTRKQKREFYQAALEMLESDPDAHNYGLCTILDRTCDKVTDGAYRDNIHIQKVRVYRACRTMFLRSKPRIWKPRTWMFLRHPSYRGGGWWWLRGEREERIKFLKFLIFKLTWL